MSFGYIGYDNPGDVGFPSPAVWGDCPNTLLNDLSKGYFAHVTGAGLIDSLPGLPEDSDAATYTYHTGSAGNRVVDAAVGAATDNHAFGIHTRPLASVVKNSGTQVWAEADIALAAITDQAWFFGLAEDAALDRDVVTDDPSNSAQAGLATESLIGFVSQQVSSQTTKFDAVYRKDANSVNTVLADAGNASAFDLGQATGVAVDRDTQVGTKPGDLEADEFVRVGVVFNGRDKLQFFVNGVKVAEQTVDSTVDQSKDMGIVLAFKAGTATNEILRYRFIRAAAQLHR